MVRITNGINEFKVSRGAFNEIYSKQGYKLVEKEPKGSAGNVITSPIISDDEKFINEIIEKPISQWSKDEVKRFAALKEIDISGTKNVGEAKEIIKNFLETQESES